MVRALGRRQRGERAVVDVGGLRIGKAALMYQIFHHSAGEGKLVK